MKSDTQGNTGNRGAISASHAIAHGNGQMRAQSISIQVSTRERCNAGCKFCIARTTPGSQDAEEVVTLCDFGRLNTGLNYAKQLGATHAILTSRSEPTLENNEYILELARTCRKHLPLLDIHTNGQLLLPGRKKYDLLKELVDAGLTMITLSIASFNTQQNQELMVMRDHARELIPIARELGLLVRCSLVTNQQGAMDFLSVHDYVVSAGVAGAHMVVVREVWIPERKESSSLEVLDWNTRNQVRLSDIEDEFLRKSESSHNVWGIRRLTDLPWGTKVFGVDNIFQDNRGVNVTFTRCDEAAIGSVVRSIVHKPDGHGYRNWDTNADVLY